jgi:hypothetical protein
VVPILQSRHQEGTAPAQYGTPDYQKYVEHWDAEKRIASELSKLRRQVKKLHRDIRGDAIPMRNKAGGPTLPTNPERRLRPLSPVPEDDGE